RSRRRRIARSPGRSWATSTSPSTPSSPSVYPFPSPAQRGESFVQLLDICPFPSYGTKSISPAWGVREEHLHGLALSRALEGRSDSRGPCRSDCCEWL